MFRRHNARPIVKKVSELVDKRSHKQRKYISLMLVPSYSTGRTRSLRIPRVVFYCILFTVIGVATVTSALWLYSERLNQQYQDTRESLYYTRDRFIEFQSQSEEEQARLLEESLYIYEQLTEEQRMFRIEQNRLRQEHDREMQEQQTALYDIQSQIDDLERMIHEFEDERQNIVSGLSDRALIPPVAAILQLLGESQAELLSNSSLWGSVYENGHIYENGYVEVAFAAFANESMPVQANVCQLELLERLAFLTTELEIQMQLLDDIYDHRQLMDPHIKNFPTLWPVSSEISSNFGWRGNPMGGRGGEFHSGIDIRAPRGTSIRAAGGGTVIFNGWQGGYGNTIIINHGNGITTLYAHNTANLANVGQRVERGDIIARVGTTGRTTGAHVHYEVRINGTAVNPRTYMLEHWSY